MQHPLPLAAWLSADRADDMPVAWSGEHLWTLAQLRYDVSRWTQALTQQPAARWALCFEDSYLFIVALLAVLHSGKKPVMPGHCRSDLLQEQQALFDGILSDQPLACGATPLLSVYSFRCADPIETPLPPLPPQCAVELYTSGSTGQPQRVIKSIAGLEQEAKLLAAHFGERLVGCRFVASIVPQHLYGLTFRIILPMSLGLPLHADMLYYTEQLSALPHGERYVFVSSPAFLKRLDESLQAPPVEMIFSAGSMLSWQDILGVRRWFGITVDEIYGSTETGILAWRYSQAEDQPWTPFPGTCFQGEGEGWRVASTLIAQEEGLLLDDNLHFNPQGQFHLLGRQGRVVKIEEKRVSLQEVERRLLALEG
ncbi:MAG: AMP-binding protein, partial [Enterobacteriaceae bacterium]